MRLSLYVISLFVGLLALLPGCSAPGRDQILAGINSFGALAITDALKEIKDTAVAKKDAAFVSTALRTDIIPFVRDHKLPASELVPQLRKLIGSKLATTPYIGIALGVASFAVANVDIKAPSMTADEQAYVLAACTAIADGCDAFTKSAEIRIKMFYDVERVHAQAAAQEGLSNEAYIKPDILVDDEQCLSVTGPRVPVRRLSCGGAGERAEAAGMYSGSDFHDR